MRFVLIDRILELVPGQSLVAVKNLSLAEEYLADHFPGFPVMPGVLMLEALTQAAAWLIRETEDFSHSVIVLRSARNIKYGSFVEPGRQLQIRVEIDKQGPVETTFRGEGVIDDQVMVKGRFTTTRYNLRDKNPALVHTDAAIVASLRDLYATLRKGSVGTAPSSEALRKGPANPPSPPSPHLEPAKSSAASVPPPSRPMMLQGRSIFIKIGPSSRAECPDGD